MELAVARKIRRASEYSETTGPNIGQTVFVRKKRKLIKKYIDIYIPIPENANNCKKACFDLKTNAAKMNNMK